MNIATHDKFKAPPPTESELKMRSILRYKKIPFRHSQIIWYTGCDKYTPDLIIGEKLIIEVDGKIHDKEYLKLLTEFVKELHKILGSAQSKK